MRTGLTAALLIVFLSAGCGESTDRSTSTGELVPQAGAVDLTLTHFREPAGTASFEPITADRTRVIIELTKQLPRGRVDIHHGPCLELGTGVRLAVGSILEGRSRVDLAVSMAELMARESSLRVHADSDEEEDVACADFGTTPAPTLPADWSADLAAREAACFEPAPIHGLGLQRGRCASVEKIVRVGAGLWRLQLRLPPVYCIELRHPAALEGDTDIAGVGGLQEVACPAAAYPNTSEPQLRVRLRSLFDGASRDGLVSLGAVGSGMTRVLVDANADWAWISPGRCRREPHVRLFELDGFYSFRSVTLLPVPLQTLLGRPHALYIDSGGAHGGVPFACADLGGA